MITLYTARIPTDHKVSISLEKMHLPYEVQFLDDGFLNRCDDDCAQAIPISRG